MEKIKGARKALLSAILVIAMCVSLLAGATYALFTSEQKVNVAVTSGKVDVVAAVNEGSLQLSSMGTDWTMNNAFENGGTVTFDAGDVKISSMTPGDKAAFEINVTNNSNVRVAYRMTVSGGETTGNGQTGSKNLLDYLTVTIDGATFSGTTTTAWKTAEIGATINDIAVSIEMPKSVTDAMDLAQTLTVTLTAVQANGVSSMPGSVEQPAIKDDVNGTMEAVTPLGTVTFDAAATTVIETKKAEIAAAVGQPVEEIVMSVGQAEDVVDDTTGIMTKTYELTLTAKLADGTTEVISDFGDGNVDVSVFVGKDITDTAFEVNYVSPDETKTTVTDGSYDAATGIYTFSTNHFSTYEVALLPATKGLSFSESADGNSYVLNTANQKLNVETVVIPSTHNGKPVTFAQDAFSSNKTIKKLVIMQGVTDIAGANAFLGCTNLASVSLPNSLTTVGNYTFEDCTSLTNIVLPSKLTLISEGMFRDCTNLENVTIPESVTEIKNNAFVSNKKLTRITIPAAVKKIGSFAFAYCSNIERYTVSPENPNYASQDGILYNKTKTTMIWVPAKLQGSIMIPANITNVGSSLKDLKLTAITVEEGNTTYFAQDGILYKSATHEIVHIPALLAGDVAIPEGVTTLLSGAGTEKHLSFFNRVNLKSIVIPTTLTNLFGYTFQNCTGLESATFTTGSKLTKIPNGMFTHCKSLVSLQIPASVTSLSNTSPLYGCDSLTTLTVEEGNTTYKSVDNCVIEIATNLLVIGCKTSKIPHGIKGIFTSAFSGCKDLVAVVLPEDLTEIGGLVFEKCTDLKEITIPASVTEIASSAFSGCTALKTINYGGTTDSWKTLSANNEWGLTDCTVYCSDGTINPNGAVTPNV